MTRASFPLPTLGPVLRQLANNIYHGVGVQILRGFPITQYAKADQNMAFLGINTWIGDQRLDQGASRGLCHIKVHNNNPPPLSLSPPPLLPLSPLLLSGDHSTSRPVCLVCLDECTHRKKKESMIVIALYLSPWDLGTVGIPRSTRQQHLVLRLTKRLHVLVVHLSYISM